MKPCLTHIAMAVRNLDASIGFYQRYCGFRVVHDRGENARRVVWLAPKESPKSMILVMMQGEHRMPQHPKDYSHLGFALGTKAEVDAIAEQAEVEGVLLWAPRQEPFPVGYYCGLVDPDGQYVEFSFGQPLGPGAPELDELDMK